MPLFCTHKSSNSQVGFCKTKLIKVTEENSQKEEDFFLHITCDMWHVTCDTWNVTHDTWHVTHDMWEEVNHLSELQLPSSYSLGVKVFWRYFHKGSLTVWLTDWLTESINFEGVCRAAQARPGLLKILLYLTYYL